MMLRRHAFDVCSTRGPERLDLVDCLATSGLRGGDDAPPVAEQGGKARIRARILGSGDRVRRHKMHALWNEGAQGVDDRGFDGAHIGHDRSGREVRTHLSAHVSKRPDRHAQDHKIAAHDGVSNGRMRFVGNTQRHDTVAHRLRTVGGHDGSGDVPQPHDPRQRRADQTEANDRDLVENGLGDWAEVVVRQRLFPSGNRGARRRPRDWPPRSQW